MPPRYMRAAAVKAAFEPPLARTAAYTLMRQLGCWNQPGVGLVVLRADFERYMQTWERRRQQGAGECASDNGALGDCPSTSERATGSATSAPQQESDASEPCTSDATAAQPASEQPLTPTGKSKHELRLAKMLAAARQQKHSAQRSKPSAPNRR